MENKKDFKPIIAVICIIMLIALFAWLIKREENYETQKVKGEGFKELETLPLDQIDSEEDVYDAICIAEETNLEASLHNKLLLKKAELQREEEIVAYFKQLALKIEDRTYIDELIDVYEKLAERSREDIKELEKKIEEFENMKKMVEEYDHEL